MEGIGVLDSHMHTPLLLFNSALVWSEPGLSITLRVGWWVGLNLNPNQPGSLRRACWFLTDRLCGQQAVTEASCNDSTAVVYTVVLSTARLILLWPLALLDDMVVSSLCRWFREG